MAHSIKITYKYLHDDEECELANSGDEIPKICEETVVQYSFDPNNNDLKVSNDVASILLNDITTQDFNDMSCELCPVYPDYINDLGAPIALIESFIFSEFPKVNSQIMLLDNADIIVDDESPKIKIILASGKESSFPNTGSEYFDLNLTDLF